MSASTNHGRFINIGTSVRLGLLLLVGFLVIIHASVVVAQEVPEEASTGKLVLVPDDLYVGETTDALGFHLELPDKAITIGYSEHFVPEGEECDSAEAGTAAFTAPPARISLTACTTGEGRVQLMEADTGTVIAEATATITQSPSASRVPRQGCFDPFSGECTSPGKPTGLEALVLGQRDIAVNWDRLGGAEKYEVEREEVGVSGSLETIEVTGIGKSFVVDAGSRHSFRVRAYGDGDTLFAVWGSWSRTVTVTTESPPTMSISRGTSPVTEGQSARFTLTASQAPSFPIPIQIAVTQEGDFLAPNPTSTVTLRRNSRTSSVIISTTNDPTCEDDGSVTVTIEGQEDDEYYTYNIKASASSDDVAITDNDCAPPSLPSVSDQTYEVGETVNLLLPDATGGNPPLTYSVSNLPSGLSFSPSTRRITGSPTTAGARTVTYRVRDADGDSDTERFGITVEPEDIEPVQPSVSDRTYEVNETVNLRLPAATGGNPPLTYTLSNLPSGLSFSPSTRRITGSPTTAGARTVTYRVRDADGDSDTETFVITVDGEPVLPSVSDRTYEVGETVNLLLPAATEGNPPLTYSASNLPSGLSFSPSTRRITGSPTTAGARTVTYRVRDDDGDSDSERFEITVEPEDIEPVLPSVSDQTYEVGETVNLLLPSATGGNPPLTYSASNLPSGLTFSPSTRRITGSPTTAGARTVTYRVRDDDGDSDSVNFRITITSTDQPGSVTLRPNTPPVVGQSITATLSDRDGGVTGESWQWESKSLDTPGGLDWEDISGAVNSEYTPAIGDLRDEIRATVTYTDAHGPLKRAESDATDPVSAPVPQPPQNLRSVAGDGMIAIEWDPVTHAASYKVLQWYGEGSNPRFRPLPFDSFKITFSRSSATISGLVNGTAYTHQVVSVNSAGESAPTQIDTNLPLAQPAGFDVIPLPERKAKLTWNAVPGSVGYTVQVRKQRGIWQSPSKGYASSTLSDGETLVTHYEIRLDEILNASTSSEDLKGLADFPHAYEFRVRAKHAFDTDLNSPNSEEIAIIDSPIVSINGNSSLPPGMHGPTLVKAVVKWDAPTGVIGYTLRWRKLEEDHTSTTWELNDTTYPDSYTGEKSIDDPGDITFTIQGPGHPLEFEKIYAVQLNYTTNSGKVFSARDRFVWPSARAAGNGERVATFPMNYKLPNGTYSYVVCEETFPTGTESIWKQFIEHAFSQWELATNDLVTVEQLDGDCADYRKFVQQILNQVNTYLSMQPSRPSDDDIRAYISSLIDNLNDGDIKSTRNDDGLLNEILMLEDVDFMMLPAASFKEISNRVIGGHCAGACTYDPFVPTDRDGNPITDANGNPLITKDIHLQESTFDKYTVSPDTLDFPGTDRFASEDDVKFNSCADTDQYPYFVLVHEAGHIFAFGDAADIDGDILDSHPNITDSVESYSVNHMYACSPHPLDIMAIYAMYQVE